MNRLSLFTLLIGTFELIGMPLGLVVESGQASLEAPAPNSCLVTADDGAILNWDSFSIGRDEAVRFVQPNVDAIAINRVLGVTPSEIFGHLSANGQILLINPNGVIFGKEAQIDVGRMIASSLNLEMSHFPYKLHFKGNSLSEISNAGSLIAKEIFLVGFRTENSGAIAANTVGLLSGSEVEIGKDISLQYLKHAEPSHAILTGTISSPGGSVYLLGEHVEISGHIDVSAPLGGGTVLIGGDFQGQNPLIENAKWTFLEKGASIRADALERGVGGRVVLWSDWGTAFYGEISANGGPLGGDGGFIEVSAHGPLEYYGLCHTSAPLGKRGTLLLDPTDVTISTGATAGVVFGGCPGGVYTASGTGAILQNTSLSGQLATGSCDVFVRTTSLGPDLGTITVEAPVEWNSPSDLNLEADFSVIIRARVANGPPAIGVGPPTGDIIVTSNAGLASGAQVLIQPGVFPFSSASIGSQDGLTKIDTPLLPVSVLGATVFGGAAQIGFVSGSGTVYPMGAIEVICDNLTLRGGTNPFPFLPGGAQIGHGSIDQSAPTDVQTLMFAPPITVTSTGMIVMESGTGTLAPNPVMIGHGGGSPGDIIFLHEQGGDITITCVNSDIIMRDIAGGITDSSITIGHGYANPTGPYMIGQLRGNISVNSLGKDILMFSNFPGMNNDVLIGHHVLGTLVGTTIGITGNIDVFAHNTINMFSQVNTQASMIGHQARIALPAVTGTYRVGAGCRLVMNGSGEYTVIGLQNSLNTLFTGDVEVASGRDIFMTTNINDTTLFNFTMIGVRTQPAGIGASISNTFVSAGRNITITPSNPALFGSQLGIDASRNVYVAAGGNIEIFGGAAGMTVISSEDSAASITRIFAAGHILATNGPSAFAAMGSSFVNYGYSLDIRAGGDIQMAASYPLPPFMPTSGAIYLEADTNLPAGAFWTNIGGNLTSVAFAALSSPLPTGIFRCTGVNASSPAIPADAFGGFRVVATPLVPLNHIVLSTTSGDITIHSASTREDGGTAQDLRIGPPNGTNNLNIVTTDGDIEIWGSVPGDAFRDIYVDGPVTTTGSILMVANRDMELTPNANITSFANFTTLVVDNFFPVRPLIGLGAFRMAGTAQVNAATTLRIYTARQGYNIWQTGASLNGLRFGIDWNLGDLFVDTNQEQWCTYFPEPFKGIPFTIFYKDCLQIIARQATLIIDEFLYDLHPADENPGWAVRFLIQYQDPDFLTEAYWLQRRQLRTINHPKSWTTVYY